MLALPFYSSYSKEYFAIKNRINRIKSSRPLKIIHVSNPKQYGRTRYHKFRNMLFEILGGVVCVKCGFSDKRALHFDHKNGGGKQDRKKFNNSSSMFLLYYVSRPELAKQKLQVLCANCNFIKMHEEKEL